MSIDSNMMQTGVKITLEELEKVLKYLPEPKCVDVILYGNFDYSSISSQAQEVVQGVKLQNAYGLVFRLENASKEKILDIYRKSNEVRNTKRPEAFVLPKGMGLPTFLKNEGVDLAVPKIIDLWKVNWYLDDHVQIEWTPLGVDVKYNDQKPSYISQLEQELVGTKVKLKIEAYRSQFLDDIKLHQ
ncbi:MAG: hypothetical protein WC916_00375 [Candidatus Woesearchaeota archaeon]